MKTEVQGGQEQASNPAKGKATPRWHAAHAHAPQGACSPGRMLLRPAAASMEDCGICAGGWVLPGLNPRSRVPGPTEESWDANTLWARKELFPFPERGRCGPGAHGEVEDPGAPARAGARNAPNHRICSMDLYWYHFQSTAWGVSSVTFTEFDGSWGEAAWFNLVSPWIFLETFWILCNYTICALGLVLLFSWQNTLC